MAVLSTVYVTKTFAEGALHVDALRGVTLDVRSGELLAIVKPSGATLPATGHAVPFQLQPALLLGSLVAGLLIVVTAS